MSINTFFVAVFVLLIGMFAYFKPNYAIDPKVGEIPAIQLQAFTLYEISHNGIDHVLKGEEGKKFDDRYEIASTSFSDHTKRFSQTVSAGNGVYKGDVIDLKGDIRYLREDGLEFHSQEGMYNTKTSVIRVHGGFEITQNQHQVNGQNLYYNTESDVVSADRIRGVYQLN